MIRNFDLHILSEREREILDLAIEGLTDQQISNQLSITASTVNSYWVRIRGKLGHLSRTELVSKIVRQRATHESSGLESRIRELETEIAKLRENDLNYSEANLLHVAIDASPEAFVVFDDKSRVIFANRRFEDLFEVAPGTARGLAISDLFSAGRNSVFEINVEELPHRTLFGLTTPLFGVKGNGTHFRAFLVIGTGELEGIQVCSCMVRPFTEEIQNAQSRASVVISDLA
jgi:DNA-binding CsgD family transcriptional regulator